MYVMAVVHYFIVKAILMLNCLLHINYYVSYHAISFIDLVLTLVHMTKDQIKMTELRLETD